MEGCETDILVDLSCPPSPPSPPLEEDLIGHVEDVQSSICPTHSCSPNVSMSSKPGSENLENNNENRNPLFDSIELERCEDNRSEKGLVYPGTPQNICNKVLRDVTNENVQRNSPKSGSPVVKLIEDEMFDFDLAFSPVNLMKSKDAEFKNCVTEVEEDDEEVFMGPVGFTERIVSVVVEETIDKVKPLSPISAGQFAEIAKEAHLMACRIGKDTTEESGKENKRGQQSCKELKFSSSNSEEVISPSKRRHSRGQTFTVSRMLSEVLPENIKVPVIECENEKETEANSRLCDENNKQETNERKSRLAVPKSSNVKGSRLPRNRSKTKLPQYGSSERIAGDASSGMDTDDGGSVASDISDASSITSHIPPKTSALAKSKSVKGSGLKKPSKLQPPSNTLSNRSFNSSNESLNSVPVQKKKIPASKSTSSRKMSSSSELPIKDEKQISQKNKIPSIKGPLAKQSLLQPSSMQMPKWGIGRGRQPSGNVPLKATARIDKARKSDSSSPTMKMAVKKVVQDIPTPVKQEKRIEQTLLVEKFSTPVRPSSTSSCTPASSRRRSCLPTPQKSRTSSLGSFPPPSPLSVRSSSGSVSSQRSGSVSSASSVSSHKTRSASVSTIESPAPSQRKLAPGSNRKSLSGYARLSELNDMSPSALKPKYPRVQNTPNMPKRVVSKWSPVQRLKPRNMDEEVTLCTKRSMNS